MANRSSRRSALLCLALAAAPAGMLGQQPGGQVSPTYTLKASTNLVVLDVVVLGADGRPVRGLKAQDFAVKEDGKPETLAGFQEHSLSQTGPPPAPPPRLAPGLFTNYAAGPVGGQAGPSNVLLLDMLNTPLRDQAYARQQIGDFLKHAPASQIAIFGLSNGLTILQGFSSNPAVLQAALAGKGTMQGSSLLNDSLGGGGGDNAGATGLSDAIGTEGNTPDILEQIANAQQFEAQTQSYQQQLRAQITLDGLNALARDLTNIPGRKNLIWFSGSFPSAVLPGASLNNGFATQANLESEFRDTMSLLARNQVSLYPVDVRGLLTSGAFNAASSNQKYARDPQAVGKDIAAFDAQIAQENTTMLDAARETGGRAFVNSNGLKQAVSAAIEDGSNYYTLSYAPANKAADGRYRKLEVTVGARKDLALSYRRGYYAEDAPPQGAAKLAGAAPQPGSAAGTAILTRSMARGAPPATQLQFTARVRLATGLAESALAPGSEAAPGAKLSGPFVRYTIDFAANPRELAFTPAGGTVDGSIRFIAFLYDKDGTLVTRAGSTLRAAFKPAVYADFLRRPLSYNLDLSAPAEGTYFLRLAIQDETSMRVGSLEVPLDAVRSLPPLQSPAASPRP